MIEPGPAPAGAPSTLLSLEGVRTGFGSHTVLHGVSFDVRQGEIAGVFGLNGAGKSVTMKVVAGIQPAWDGTVRLGGRDVTALGPEDRVGLGIANVPQGRQVFPELTVEENLRLGAYTLRRRNRARYEPLLDRILTQFPVLAERRRQMAGTMSGGEQASLAVARALMSEPNLILVDEPSAGLAPKIVEDLFTILRDVNRTGVTILLVEQNVTFGLKLVDTAHVMQRGRIVYSGAVGSLDPQRMAEHLGIGRLLGGALSAVGREGGSDMEVER